MYLLFIVFVLFLISFFLIFYCSNVSFHQNKASKNALSSFHYYYYFYKSGLNRGLAGSVISDVGVQRG